MNMISIATMGNNLKFYIKMSGKTQVEVAKLKGIAPESLSRHIAGRSQFSIQDAIEYAQILRCTPEQLLFEQKPIQVLGTVHANNIVTMADPMEPKQFIQMNMTPQQNWGLIRMEHTGSWKYADGGYVMILSLIHI